MQKLLAAALALALGAAARADGNLTLATTTPPASPIAVNPGGTSGPLFVTVSNDSAPVIAANFMRGWQFSLSLVPDSGTTGTLLFNSPPTGTAANPPNYV